LEAVQSSNKLTVRQPWAAKVAGDAISDRIILETKIRCADQWDRWVLTGNASSNKPATNVALGIVGIPETAHLS